MEKVWIVSRHNELVATAATEDLALEILDREQAKIDGVWTVQACPVVKRIEDWTN